MGGGRDQRRKCEYLQGIRRGRKQCKRGHSTRNGMRGSGKYMAMVCKARGKRDVGNERKGMER